MIKKYLFTLSCSLSMGILTATTLKAAEPNGEAQWDFDHNVQFRQTQLGENYYQLEMIRTNSANFERLTTFLIRKSYSLCGRYHYKLEMIQGIEEFDDSRAMPNYIHPSLIAKVECSLASK